MIFGQRFCLKVFESKEAQNKVFQVLWKSRAWNFSDFLHNVAKLPQGIFVTKNLALGQKEVQNEVFKFYNRFHLYSKISNSHIFGKTVADISLQNILVFFYKNNLICRRNFSSSIWIMWKTEANFCVANINSEILNASPKSKNQVFTMIFRLLLKILNICSWMFSQSKYCD